MARTQALSVSNKQRYFALLFPKDRLGYSIDYYPEEYVTYKREYRRNIIGDFGSIDEAQRAITKALKGGWSVKRASRSNLLRTRAHSQSQ